MIAIVDYKAGNLTSVLLALNEVGVEAVVTSDREVILAANHVIFPGVGAAGTAMQELEKLGLKSVLTEYLNSGKPFLGICIGMQVLMEWSLEDGKTPCLGFVSGGTAIFESSPKAPIKVPHMGWNQVDLLKGHPVLAGIPSGSEFYFVHSYYPAPESRDCILAETTYGETRFTSIIAQKNLIACQFHTEKSGRWGLQLLKNFSQWNGQV